MFAMREDGDDIGGAVAAEIGVTMDAHDDDNDSGLLRLLADVKFNAQFSVK